MRGRPLALDDPASAEGAVLLAQLRRGHAGRRTWLLDIATDLGIPAVAAVSCRADGKGFAFGLSARPTVAGAVRGAIMELCQNELAQAVVAAKQHESGPDKLNARDRAHIVRATQIDADACALLHPQGMPVRREACASEDAVSQIGWLATRLAAAGIDTFVIDLTRPRYAVRWFASSPPACRSSPRSWRAPACNGPSRSQVAGLSTPAAWSCSSGAHGSHRSKLMRREGARCRLATQMTLRAGTSRGLQPALARAARPHLDVRDGLVAIETRRVPEDAYRCRPAAQPVDVVEKGYAVAEAQ